MALPNNEQVKRITNGLIEMDMSTGSVMFRVGDRSFKTIEDATDFITSMNMTNRETFQASKTMVDYLRAPSGLPRGIQTPEGLINMAQRIGPRKRIEVYQLDTEKMQGEILTDGTATGDFGAIKKNFTNEAGDYTALIMPGKTTVVQQYYDEDLGRYLTADEIIALHREHGIVPFNAKAPKRYRQTTRSGEVMGQVDKRYTVGVFDNEAVLRRTYEDMPDILDEITNTKAAMAADGQSLMSPAVVEDLEKMIRDRRSKVAREAGKEPDTATRAALRKYDKQLEELKGLKIHGGRFNYRIDVFDFAGSSDLTDDEIKLLQNMVGSPKGDVLVPAGGMKAWSRIVQKYGGSGGFKAGDDTLTAGQVHFISTIGSIPNDAGEYVGNAARKRFSTITLSPHEIIKDTWLDPQHFTAHPDLFTVDALHNETMAHFNRSLAMLQETGTLPPGMVDQMRQHVDESGKILSEFNKSDKYAAHILDFIDAGGDIRESPELMRMATSSLQKYYRDPKHGERIRFMVPDAVRAPISPYDMAYDTARQIDIKSTTLPMMAPEDMARRSVTYVPGRGLAFHPLDIPAVSEALGGSDFDDYSIANLRYDKSRSQYAAVMTRSPTTMGEHIVLDVDEFDPLTEEILKRKNPQYTFLSRVKKLDAAAASHNNLEEKVARLNDALADAHYEVEGYEKLGMRQNANAVNRDILRLHQEWKNATEALERKTAQWDQSLRSSMSSIESIMDDVPDALRDQLEAAIETGTGRTRVNMLIQDLLKEAHSKALRQNVQEMSGSTFRDLFDSSVSHDLYYGGNELHDSHPFYNLLDKEGNKVTAQAYKDDAFKTIAELEKKQKAIMEGSLVGDEALGLVESTAKELKVLGAYSNTKMIMDEMLATNQEHWSAIEAIIGKDFKIDIPQIEAVIDSATAGAGDNRWFNAAKLTQTQEQIGALAAKVQHESGGTLRIGLDRTLFDEKAKGPVKKAYDEGFRAYWNERLAEDEAGILAQYGVESKEAFFEKVRLEDNFVDGRYTELARAGELAKVEIQRAVNAANAKVKYNSFYTDTEFAKQAHTDADFLEELYRRGRSAYDGMPPSLPEGIDNIALMRFSGYDSVMEQGAQDLLGRDLIHGARLLSTDSDERLFNAIGVLKQRHNEGTSRVSSRILYAGGTEESTMRDASIAADRFFGAFARPTEVPIDEIRVPHGIGGDISDNVINIAKEFYSENVVGKGTISKGMISLSEGLTKLGKVPGVRGIAAAGLAVVAGSILYQGYKDRTYHDMDGPPLLPGGSAYENYPVESAQIPSAAGGSVTRGTTYDIYATGSFDQDKINKEISKTAGVSPSVYSYNSRSRNSGGSMEQYIASRFK
jgi:hypothetical protein